MPKLRNQFIYQVFVRNYSKEGTLNALTADLDRLAAMNVDILYLMPIQPIGIIGRKGEYGSPYAIKDYQAISPDLGTLEDFSTLLAEAHKKGLKVMLDIVFHHTSFDHAWISDHPEFYHYDSNGKIRNKVEEWNDIAELNYDNPLLRRKLTDILLYWTTFGIDGFRFDVASMLPLDFMQEAFTEIRRQKPDMIFLAESVHKEFIGFLRAHHYVGLSDSQCFQVFDICYDYDINQEFTGYLKGENDLETFRNMLRLQEVIYPVDYVKARNVENHDIPRIQYFTQNTDKTLQWIAYCFFAKGIAFLHMGVETGTDHLSRLFEKDPLHWEDCNQETVFWITGLAKMKKDPIFAENGLYRIISHKKDILHFEYENDSEIRVGIFNVGLAKGVVNVSLPEGIYSHDITKEPIEVRYGTLALSNIPIIFTIKK